MTARRDGTLPLLDSMSEIAGAYDAWLVDLWGVLHNGASAIEPAIDACERYRAEGGIVVLISNAPRPQESVRAQIMTYGVPLSVDDGIVTSGDVTRHLIAAEAGRPLYHIGPPRDRGLFAGIDVELVEADDADLVVLSGLWDDDTETPEDYRDLLESLHARDLPMICANPDIKVERGIDVIYAAGAIAALYEQLGGRVVYAGKPHAPIYASALALIDERAGRDVPRTRILAIGDGIDTDIRGAAQAGLPSLFIPSGIHAPEGGTASRPTQVAITALFEGRGFAPIAAMSPLSW